MNYWGKYKEYDHKELIQIIDNTFTSAKGLGGKRMKIEKEEVGEELLESQ